MTYYSAKAIVRDAFMFALSGVITGYFINIIGVEVYGLNQSLGNFYGVSPSLVTLVYVYMLAIVTLIGILSEIDTLLVRGLFFTFAVSGFDYLLKDYADAGIAFLAAVLLLLIAGMKYAQQP